MNKPPAQPQQEEASSRRVASESAGRQKKIGSESTRLPPDGQLRVGRLFDLLVCHHGATVRQSTTRKAWNDTSKQKAPTRRLNQKGP